MSPKAKLIQLLNEHEDGKFEVFVTFQSIDFKLCLEADKKNNNISVFHVEYFDDEE